MANTHTNPNPNPSTLYVIGENYYGQLGRVSIGDMQSVLSTLPSDITHVYFGKDFSLFRDTHNNHYSAGYNNEGSCATLKTVKNNAFLPFSPLSFPTHMHVRVCKVCVNVSAQSVFWITDSHRIFGNGNNRKSQLGLGNGNDSSLNALKLIPFFDAQTLIIDIQASNEYSLALSLPNNICVSLIREWTIFTHEQI